MIQSPLSSISNAEFFDRSPSGVVQDLKDSFAFSLYKYNLNDLKPHEGTHETYGPFEQQRLEIALHRASMEIKLLNRIRKPRSVTAVDIFDKKDSLYESICNYATKGVDNSYVDWFERYATTEDAAEFVKEYGADQVYFTQYLSQLAVIAPEPAAVEIYSNLFDETGRSTLPPNERDFSRFHPQIFRRLNILFKIDPATRFHNIEIFNPGTYYCICLMLLAIRLGYLAGAGAMFFLERSIPSQLCKISSGLKKLNISNEDRLFLDMHCELDTDHAIAWWKYAIKDYLIDESSVDKLLLGIDIAIEARKFLWSGLLIKARK